MHDSKYNQRSDFLDSQLYTTRAKLRIFSDFPRKENGMGCLGVHFALTEPEVIRLLQTRSDRDRLSFLQESIEETYFGGAQEFMCETDKAWDAIHRALTDGHLGYENGEFPQSHVILGGKPICFDDDYIMSLKTPSEVGKTAEWLCTLTVDQFRVGYFKIDPALFGSPIDEDDFDYTWYWLDRLRAFFGRAAADDRFVLFTANQ